MPTKLEIVLKDLKEDREIRSEDFSPWSYNLHYLSSNEPWGYRNHRHFGCFELVYMLHGSVEHLMKGEWMKFSQGDLLAVGEEDFHAIRGSSFSYANLILPVSFWESWVNGLGLEDPLGSPRTCQERTVNIAPDTRDEFESFLDRLFRFQQPDFYFFLSFKSLLCDSTVYDIILRFLHILDQLIQCIS